MDIRLISAEQTRPLRNKILRPKQIEPVVLPGDERPDTFHLGAVDNGALAAVVTLHPSLVPDDSPNSWQLRGMAVDTSYQGKGVGMKLLQEVFRQLKQRGALRVWCTARLHAVEFYRKAGFGVEGDQFDIPDIGPHVIMGRAL